jgi:hypothetical protein
MINACRQGQSILIFRVVGRVVGMLLGNAYGSENF